MGEEVRDGVGEAVRVCVWDDVLVELVVGMKVTMGVEVAVSNEDGVSVEVGCTGSFPVIGVVGVSVPSVTGGCAVFVRTLSRPKIIAVTSVGVCSPCPPPFWLSVEGALSSDTNAIFIDVSLAMLTGSTGSLSRSIGLPIEPGKPRLSAVKRRDNSSRIPQTTNGLASIINKRRRRTGVLIAHLFRCSGMRFSGVVTGSCVITCGDCSRKLESGVSDDT